MNIKRTLKRLIDDTQYVAALEKQNDLLKENLQQEKDNLQKQKEDFRREKEQEVADEEAQYRNVAATTSALSRICRSGCWRTTSSDTMSSPMFSNTARRINETEHDFEIIDKYAINTIAIEVQEAGIFVRDHFVERLIKSKYAQPYHPIRSYINQVRGTWDGKDKSATSCAASTILTIARRWEESGYVPWWHRWRDTTRNMPTA